MRLELGDLYSREPKLVLLEFLVTSLAPDTIDIARLVLEGALIGADGSVKQQEIVIDLATSFADGPVSNAEVRREMLLLEAARVRQDVIREEQLGNYDVAYDKMLMMSEKLRAAGVNDVQVREEAADFELLSQQMQPGVWGMAETKYMFQRSYDSSRAMRSKTQHIARTKRKKPEGEA